MKTRFVIYDDMLRDTVTQHKPFWLAERIIRRPETFTLQHRAFDGNFYSYGKLAYVDFDFKNDYYSAVFAKLDAADKWKVVHRVDIHSKKEFVSRWILIWPEIEELWKKLEASALFMRDWVEAPEGEEGYNDYDEWMKIKSGHVHLKRFGI